MQLIFIVLTASIGIFLGSVLQLYTLVALFLILILLSGLWLFLTEGLEALPGMIGLIGSLLIGVSAFITYYVTSGSSIIGDFFRMYIFK